MFQNKNNYSFNKKTGQFIPINLKPTNLTKCLNCGEQVSFEKIQSHLAKHIGQDVIGQQRQHDTQAQNPLKLQDSLSMASTTNDLIDTQTIMASELPSHQIYKMNINQPQHNQHNQNQNQMKMKLDVNSQISVNRDDLDLWSRVQSDNIDSLKKVQVSQGDYYEKIKIQHRKVNNKIKQINLYTKSNHGQNSVEDKFTTKSKTHKEQIQQKGSKYRIEMIPEEQQKNPNQTHQQRQSRESRQLRQSENNNNKIIQIAFGQGHLEGARSNRFTTYASHPLQNLSTQERQRRQRQIERYTRYTQNPNEFNGANLNGTNYGSGSTYVRNGNGRNSNQRGVQQPFWLCSQRQRNGQNSYQQNTGRNNYGRNGNGFSSNGGVNAYGRYGNGRNSNNGTQQPFWLCSQLHKGPKEEYEAHNHNTDNCQCPCCGGFYCPVCKSTIPPQFRRLERPNLEKSKVTVWGGQN